MLILWQKNKKTRKIQSKKFKGKHMLVIYPTFIYIYILSWLYTAKIHTHRLNIIIFMCWHVPLPYTHRKTKNHDDCTTTVYCIKIIKMRDTTTNTIDCCILLTLHCTSLLYTTINIFDDVCVCTTILHIHNTTHTQLGVCVCNFSL